MKKLKDFDVKKVKLDNIYGGRVAAETNARTCTVGDNGGNPDDGDDHWDDPF